MKYIYVVTLTALIASNIVYGSSGVDRVKLDINVLGSGLDLFYFEFGRYPTTEEGLAALVNPPTTDSASPSQIMKKLPKDPWGYEYKYQFPGARNEGSFDLWSNGADGISGGDGFDSEVGNWPDGFTKYYAARSAARLTARRDRIFDALPMASLIGVIFSGSIYLGISMLRLSDGVQRRKSFTGKSIWIGLVFFALYWIAALPPIVQTPFE